MDVVDTTSAIRQVRPAVAALQPMHMVAYRSPGLAQRRMATSATGFTGHIGGCCDVRVLAAGPFGGDDHGFRYPAAAGMWIQP